MHAVHCNHLDTVACLIKHGADLDYREPITGSTALHDAAYQSSPLMVYAYRPVVLLRY
jgi:ankyrin repeat protein